MRDEVTMMALIMDKAKSDQRIKAVAITGSRIDSNATVDRFQDYDIVYIVTDIQALIKEDKLTDYFGEILIVQKPMDWYKEPYDFNGIAPFTYLMQFTDGTRVDLTLIDMNQMKAYIEGHEPRHILLDKIGIEGLTDIDVGSAYYVKKPSEKEFFNTCNEFWWITLYVAKGLCREEVTYARQHYEHYLMDMVLKMLDIWIGNNHDFHISTGKAGRYLKRYLAEDEMQTLSELYPCGDFEAIWEKLLKVSVYFHHMAIEVSKSLFFEYDLMEAEGIMNSLKQLKTHKAY